MPRSPAETVGRYRYRSAPATRNTPAIQRSGMQISEDRTFESLDSQVTTARSDTISTVHDQRQTTIGIQTEPEIPTPVATLQNAKANSRASSSRENAFKPIQAGERAGDCCICFDGPCDSVFYRCGHVCSCISCAKQLVVCPICRIPIVDVIKLFFVALRI